MTPNVAFIDTETLGLDPDIHPVWEIGLILPDGTEREWQVKVTDRAISLAHPKALEISRFHERYGKTRATDLPEHVCRDLYDLIPEGCHLAGAVPNFDEERLRRLMWKHGYSPRWHYHLIDVETLAVAHIVSEWRTINELGVGNPKTDGYSLEDLRAALPPWDSEKLSELVGVDTDDFDKHTALSDARWAKALYVAVLGDPGDLEQAVR